MPVRSSELGGALLSMIATVWPDPSAKRKRVLGTDPTSESYHQAYAVRQFMSKVSSGMRVQALPPLWGKEVLEVGCGHGGISCYLASIGAARVVGIDLAEDRLRYARELRERIEGECKRELPVEFMEMDAMNMSFAEGSFDLVVADNLIEHVSDVSAFLEETHRVLRPGGVLVAPVFSSIWSKWGLHLKHGIRIPWANLVFSEAAIVDAVKRQAEKRPELYEVYPGLTQSPTSVCDLRRHRDLNGITYREFQCLAEASGFETTYFDVHVTELGRVVRRFLPNATRGRLGDILSTGAAAVLTKREPH